MGNHNRGNAVKPLIPASLLAKVAAHCVDTSARLLAEREGKANEAQIVWDAVDMARLLIVHSHEVASRNNATAHSEDVIQGTTHFRGGARGIVAIGLDDREDDTADEDLDPISGG